mgnify:CR=1 FL=1
MPIRKYKPTSPARRFYTVQVFDEITTQDPYRPLTEPLRKSGGRNNHGELTSWWRGGGHKRNYRIIDFKRDKHGIPATVSTVEYDPNRSARIALVTYADGEKRYILHPKGLNVGDMVMSGPQADVRIGSTLPLEMVRIDMRCLPAAGLSDQFSIIGEAFFTSVGFDPLPHHPHG